MKRLIVISALFICAPILASVSPGPAASPDPEEAAPAEQDAAGVEAAQTETVAEPETPAIDGQVVFQQHCQSCHAAVEGQYSPIGPNLAGVVGREAGTADFRYSPALRASGITWTREQLDKYIASPNTAVPGTRMSIGLDDDAQRAAVIDYLATTGE